MLHVEPPVESFDVHGRFSRHVDQRYFGIWIGKVLEANGEPVIEPAVKKLGPQSYGVSPKLQFRADATEEFGKNNVDRNDVGIQAIDAESENKLISQSPKSEVPQSPQSICSKTTKGN